MVALPDYFILSRVIWLFNIAAHFVLAARLRSENLNRRYQWFTVYLIVAGLQLTVHFGVYWRSNLYGYLWLATEPIIWGLYILVLLELYNLVLADYPGIQSWGRKVILAALAISILIAMAMSQSDVGEQTGLARLRLYALAVDKGVLFAMLLFLFLATAAVAALRVALRRNLVLHAVLFFVYFLSSTLSFLVTTVTGRGLSAGLDLLLLCSLAVCLTLWTLLFSKSGETGRMERNAALANQHESGVLAHMQTLNQTLARISDKNTRISSE